MQINNNINNSTSFGKILKFDNQIAKMFEKPLYSKSIKTKETYAELLDTFAKSEPIKEFIAKNDVNVRFTRDLDLETEMVNMKVSIESPDKDACYPTIWEAESDGYSECTNFKTLAKKIASLTLEKLEEGKKNRLQLMAEYEHRFGLDELSKHKKLNEQIQNSINSIMNM